MLHPQLLRLSQKNMSSLLLVLIFGSFKENDREGDEAAKAGVEGKSQHILKRILGVLLCAQFFTDLKAK